METDTPIQLLKKIVIRGSILTHGGLHIGGTNTGMDIGGVKAFVIREPLTNQPYIPGSSLKGKMRSLLEVYTGKVGTKPMTKDVQNGPCVDPGAPSAQLFGYITQNASKNKSDSEKQGQQPSRIIVRDAFLRNAQQVATRTDLNFTELKTEVVIDRITSKANPRTMERVPHQSMFGFEIVLNIFAHEADKEAEFLNNLWVAMRLLQDDYLGGKGSRGCGQIDICVESIEERTRDWYLNPAALPNMLEAKLTDPRLLQFSFPLDAIVLDAQPEITR